MIAGDAGINAGAQAATGTMKELANDRPFGESLAQPFLGSQEFKDGLTSSVATGVRNKISDLPFGMGDLFLNQPQNKTASWFDYTPTGWALNKVRESTGWALNKVRESAGTSAGTDKDNVKSQVQGAVNSAVQTDGKAIGEHIGNVVTGNPAASKSMPGASPFVKGFGEEFANNAGQAIRTNPNLDTTLGLGANLMSGDFGGMFQFIGNKMKASAAKPEDFLTEAQGRDVGKAYAPGSPAMQGFSDKMAPLANDTAQAVIGSEQLGLNGLGKGIGHLMTGNLDKFVEGFIPADSKKPGTGAA